MTGADRPDEDRLTRAARDALTGWRTDDPAQQQWRAHYLDHVATNTRPWSRACPGSHLTASSLIVDPERRRVALVFHGKARLWLQTGGHIEADDADLTAAALREATEESGLTGLRVLDGPTRLSRHPAPCGSADWHLDVQYTVVTTGDVDLGRGAEADPVEWFSPDALPEPSDDDVHALVHASLHRLAAPSAPAQPSTAGTPAASDQPSR